MRHLPLLLYLGAQAVGVAGSSGVHMPLAVQFSPSSCATRFSFARGAINSDRYVLRQHVQAMRPLYACSRAVALWLSAQEAATSGSVFSPVPPPLPWAWDPERLLLSPPDPPPKIRGRSGFISSSARHFSISLSRPASGVRNILFDSRLKPRLDTVNACTTVATHKSSELAPRGFLPPPIRS